MNVSDFMEEPELFTLLGKKKTAVWRLRKDHGFPNPVLTHPSRYSRKAVMKWLEEGGVNRINNLVVCTIK
ncbi:TPA: DNA-binding protein [Klebsiella pneumoniae]|nr:DNA-binding protein [Klebsiella pneumoniae]